MASEILASSYKRRSHSPEFSDTLNSHVFITNVFDQNTVHRSAETTTASTPATTTTSIITSNSHWPHKKDNNLRHSLEEISKDIQSIDDFLTVSEEVLRRERERDRQLYARERQRKRASGSEKKKTKEIDAKSNLTKSPPITYRINSATFRKGTKKSSLAFGKKNSKISSVEEDGILMFQPISPVFSTINKTSQLSSGGDSDSLSSLTNAKLCDNFEIMEINNVVKENTTECDSLEMVIIDSGTGGTTTASETKAMDVIENTKVVYGAGSGSDNRTIAPNSASSMQSNVT